jgi:hypothetical protein
MLAQAKAWGGAAPAREGERQGAAKPRRCRDILDRVALDEAKTLRAIGGEALADAFLHAYEAAESMEILSEEAGFVVRVGARGRLAEINDAPSVVPLARDLEPRRNRRIQQSHHG